MHGGGLQCVWGHFPPQGGPSLLALDPASPADGPTPRAGLLGAWTYLGVATEGRQLK